MPDRAPPGEDLHARKDGDEPDHDKRKGEAEAVKSVAGAMAGEAVAAVTGKGKRRADKTSK